ncbi:hypothetical protein CYY_004428 [Polysphondylium violaceum]|uniref:Uncharacterized protein n=2 Tax=Polysphondylium violaceum TaxID=133409 RepID=A0A8J4PX17_9MYCE|nr:hypothetical protein CYY_004428 [Polysphondylium violaceum]
MQTITPSTHCNNNNNHNNGTNAFFSILRNKYINRIIVGHVLYRDPFLSLDYLFKAGRFDIFDLKWQEYTSNGFCTMDFSDHDLQSFFQHNTSYERFLKVWPVIEPFCKPKNWIQACSRCTISFDKAIITTLIDVLFRVNHLSKSTFLSYDIFKELNHAESLDIVKYFLGKKYPLPLSTTPVTHLNFEYWDELSNITAHKNLEIAKYALKELENSPVKFFLDSLSVELIQYILDNYVNQESNRVRKLTFHTFPPKQIEKALMVINHSPRVEFMVLNFNFEKAAKKGDLQFLQYMYTQVKKMEASAPSSPFDWIDPNNHQSIQFFSTQFPKIEIDFKAIEKRQSLKINKKSGKDINVLKNYIEKNGVDKLDLLQVMKHAIEKRNTQVINYLLKEYGGYMLVNESIFLEAVQDFEVLKLILPFVALQPWYDKLFIQWDHIIPSNNIDIIKLVSKGTNLITKLVDSEQSSLFFDSLTLFVPVSVFKAIFESAVTPQFNILERILKYAVRLGNIKLVYYIKGLIAKVVPLQTEFSTPDNQYLNNLCHRSILAVIEFIHLTQKGYIHIPILCPQIFNTLFDKMLTHISRTKKYYQPLYLALLDWAVIRQDHTEINRLTQTGIPVDFDDFTTFYQQKGAAQYLTLDKSLLTPLSISILDDTYDPKTYFF